MSFLTWLGQTEATDDWGDERASPSTDQGSPGSDQKDWSKPKLIYNC